MWIPRTQFYLDRQIKTYLNIDDCDSHPIRAIYLDVLIDPPLQLSESERKYNIGFISENNQFTLPENNTVVRAIYGNTFRPNTEDFRNLRRQLDSTGQYLFSIGIQSKDAGMVIGEDKIPVTTGTNIFNLSTIEFNEFIKTLPTRAW